MMPTSSSQHGHNGPSQMRKCSAMRTNDCVQCKRIDWNQYVAIIEEIVPIEFGDSIIMMTPLKMINTWTICRPCPSDIFKSESPLVYELKTCALHSQWNHQYLFTVRQLHNVIFQVMRSLLLWWSDLQLNPWIKVRLSPRLLASLNWTSEVWSTWTWIEF